MYAPLKILFFISFCLFLTSCFKEDEKMIIEEKGSFFHIPAPNNIRSYFSYIDLDSVRLVKTAPISSWDLAFEGSSEGWHILVNAANNKEIYPTGSFDIYSDFSSVNPTVWQFDVSNGNPDSTAVGSWVTGNPGNAVYTKQVYLMGMNNGNGTYEKLKKLQFIELTPDQYIILAANPDGTVADTIRINKNPSYNYVYYSFSSPNETLLIEPEKDKWDLVACTYRTTLFTSTGVPTPYSVGGLLSNFQNVQVLRVNKPDFFAAGVSDTIGQTFSIKKDAIGWEWKEYSSTGGSNPYRIVPDIYYFVKTKSGKLVKLEFTSYYSSENGENGYPTFRYVNLN
jgi:hypothetical protein